VFRFLKKKKTVERLSRIDTEKLAALRSAQTLLRLHLSAGFALGVATLICILGLAGAALFLISQNIDHVLKLSGVLHAVEQSIPVTHDTGGIVSNVFITDGEIVAEGQVLMSLDASDIENSLEEAQRIVASLMLQSLCLKAEQRKNLTVSVPPELKIAVGRLNQLEELKRSIQKCHGKLRKTALYRLKEKASIAAMQNKVHLYSRLSHEGKSLKGRLHQLANDGQEQDLQRLVNQQQLIEILRDLIILSDAQNQLVNLKVAQKETAIAQAQRFHLKFNQITDALAMAEQKLSKLDHIKKNRFIYASNSGRIQRLRISKGGKRIARGAHILEIAPLSTDFEILATVNVSELPYIHIGQKVTVSLSSDLPKAVAVPASIINILKATENTRTLTIALKREDLNRRDLLIGERSLNGLGERSEAVIEVQSDNALSTLKSILWNSLLGTKI